MINRVIIMLLPILLVINQLNRGNYFSPCYTPFRAREYILFRETGSTVVPRPASFYSLSNTQTESSVEFGVEEFDMK